MEARSRKTAVIPLPSSSLYLSILSVRFVCFSHYSLPTGLFTSLPSGWSTVHLAYEAGSVSLYPRASQIKAMQCSSSVLRSFDSFDSFAYGRIKVSACNLSPSTFDVPFAQKQSCNDLQLQYRTFEEGFDVILRW
jgi:hypothetical protein